MTLLAGALFIVTLGLVVWRPRNLPIGWTASVAAALALVLRLVTWGDVRAATAGAPSWPSSCSER